MRANQLLKNNVLALLKLHQKSRKDLAIWCYRSESWISKIFKETRREFPNKYLDRMADFFGLATYQLFQPGISPLTERRRSERRIGRERRISAAHRMMQETAAELDRVRPVTGKTRHADEAQVPDPIQRILDQAARQIHQVRLVDPRPALANTRRQTTVARRTKAAARSRARAVGGSDDSSSPPKPVKPPLKKP